MGGSLNAESRTQLGAALLETLARVPRSLWESLVQCRGGGRDADAHGDDAAEKVDVERGGADGVVDVPEKGQAGVARCRGSGGGGAGARARARGGSPQASVAKSSDVGGGGGGFAPGLGGKVARGGDTTNTRARSRSCRSSCPR